MARAHGISPVTVLAIVRSERHGRAVAALDPKLLKRARRVFTGRHGSRRQVMVTVDEKPGTNSADALAMMDEFDAATEDYSDLAEDDIEGRFLRLLTSTLVRAGIVPSLADDPVL